MGAGEKDDHSETINFLIDCGKAMAAGQLTADDIRAKKKVMISELKAWH